MAGETLLLLWNGNASRPDTKLHSIMNACYKSLEVTFIYVFGVETVTLGVCRGQTTACSYGSWGLNSRPQACQQALLPLSQLAGPYCEDFASGLMVPC